MPPSATFLGLPLEIRDMILLLFLRGPQSDPPSLVELAKQQRLTVKSIRDPNTRLGRSVLEEGDRGVLFPREPPNNPALALLLTNRQLHIETLDALRRAFPITNPKPPYIVDIIYLKDSRSLWPTWLSVPGRASHVDTVHAQFRVFTSPDDLLIEDKPASQFLKGSSLTHALYHLLDSSLTVASCGPCRQPISVNRLVLDFLPPLLHAETMLPMSPYTTWAWVGEPKVHAERVFAKDIQEKVFDGFSLYEDLRAVCLDDPGMEVAARLMCFVLDWLKSIAGMGRHKIDYSLLLYERVGVLEVRLGGKSYKILSLDELLADYLRWDRGFGLELQRRRRELGLSV